MSKFKPKSKSFDDLKVADFQEYPVWEFTHTTTGGDEMDVAPIKEYPVTETDNRVLSLQIRLNCGEMNWAIMGGIEPEDHRFS